VPSRDASAMCPLRYAPATCRHTALDGSARSSASTSLRVIVAAAPAIKTIAIKRSALDPGCKQPTHTTRVRASHAFHVLAHLTHPHSATNACTRTCSRSHRVLGEGSTITSPPTSEALVTRALQLLVPTRRAVPFYAGRARAAYSPAPARAADRWAVWCAQTAREAQGGRPGTQCVWRCWMR
jgi:hypothetical protein